MEVMNIYGKTINVLGDAIKPNQVFNVDGEKQEIKNLIQCKYLEKIKD